MNKKESIIWKVIWTFLALFLLLTLNLMLFLSFKFFNKNDVIAQHKTYYVVYDKDNANEKEYLYLELFNWSEEYILYKRTTIGSINWILALNIPDEIFWQHQYLGIAYEHENGEWTFEKDI